MNCVALRLTEKVRFCHHFIFFLPALNRLLLNRQQFVEFVQNFKKKNFRINNHSKLAHDQKKICKNKHELQKINENVDKFKGVPMIWLWKVEVTNKDNPITLARCIQTENFLFDHLLIHNKINYLLNKTFNIEPPSEESMWKIKYNGMAYFESLNIIQIAIIHEPHTGYLIPAGFLFVQLITIQ